MRKLHFLKIPFGFDFKFNFSDKYECNGGQNYENLIWELLSLLDAVLDRRVEYSRKIEQHQNIRIRPYSKFKAWYEVSTIVDSLVCFIFWGFRNISRLKTAIMKPGKNKSSSLSLYFYGVQVIMWCFFCFQWTKKERWRLHKTIKKKTKTIAAKSTSHWNINLRKFTPA